MTAPKDYQAKPGNNAANVEVQAASLADAIARLVNAAQHLKDSELDDANQQAPIGEQMGIGKPTEGGGFKSPLTEMTRQDVIEGETVTVPDRQYYAKQEIEDDAGVVFYFLPIKQAKFRDARQQIVIFNFAEPDQRQYLAEP
jgi:hypothetical protein